jgi:hypothetical protein
MQQSVFQTTFERVQRHLSLAQSRRRRQFLPCALRHPRRRRRECRPPTCAKPSALKPSRGPLSLAPALAQAAPLRNWPCRVREARHNPRVLDCLVLIFQPYRACPCLFLSHNPRNPLADYASHSPSHLFSTYGPKPRLLHSAPRPSALSVHPKATVC